MRHHITAAVTLDAGVLATACATPGIPTAPDRGVVPAVVSPAPLTPTPRMADPATEPAPPTTAPTLTVAPSPDTENWFPGRTRPRGRRLHFPPGRPDLQLCGPLRVPRRLEPGEGRGCRAQAGTARLSGLPVRARTTHRPERPRGLTAGDLRRGHSVLRGPAVLDRSTNRRGAALSLRRPVGSAV
jgi:hypothetical protein